MIMTGSAPAALSGGLAGIKAPRRFTGGMPEVKLGGPSRRRAIPSAYPDSGVAHSQYFPHAFPPSPRGGLHR